MSEAFDQFKGVIYGRAPWYPNLRTRNGSHCDLRHVGIEPDVRGGLFSSFFRIGLRAGASAKSEIVMMTSRIVRNYEAERSWLILNNFC
jgi:hypothetical protein